MEPARSLLQLNPVPAPPEKNPCSKFREFALEVLETWCCFNAENCEITPSPAKFAVLARESCRDGFAQDCIYHHTAFRMCRFPRVAWKGPGLRAISRVALTRSGAEMRGETVDPQFSGKRLSSRFRGPDGEADASVLGCGSWLRHWPREQRDEEPGRPSAQACSATHSNDRRFWNPRRRD